MHVTKHATSVIASYGGSQAGQNGFSKYCANVKAVIAFPVGTKISSATQRYRNAGSGPNAVDLKGDH